MRKKFFICSAALFVLLMAIGWNLQKDRRMEQNESILDRIGRSPCAKFEYSGSKGKGLLITSEIGILSYTFLSLDITRSDKPVSKWIYRITFNCKELYLSDEEIVVLIGPDSMSINGENYSTPENVPFANVVDLFASKYKYFVDETVID